MAARVEIQKHPVPSTAPGLETVFLTITPACFLSNLTQWPLHLAITGSLSHPDETLRVRTRALPERSSLLNTRFLDCQSMRFKSRP